MTILAIETAIVARLAAALTGLRVEAFPDSPDTYRLQHPRGAVLVGYGRSDYGRPLATGPIVQDRRLEFDITVLARHLRDHGGAYGVLDAVRIALTGFRPAGATGLQPVRDRFLAVRDGVWRYAITLATTMPALETADEEQGPLLRQVAFTETVILPGDPA